MHHSQVDTVVERLTNEIPGMADLGDNFGNSLMVAADSGAHSLEKTNAKGRGSFAGAVCGLSG